MSFVITEGGGMKLPGMVVADHVSGYCLESLSYGWFLGWVEKTRDMVDWFWWSPTLHTEREECGTLDCSRG
jgi:hypothetical protein